MIAIGSDHGGYELKKDIVKLLESKNISYKDFGCYSNESVDYPEYAKKVCGSIINGECEKGILICGAGIGVSIAANKIKGIRAALCSDCYTAAITREHNDSNVLCLAGRVVGVELAKRITEIFLSTKFSNDERHIKRISQLED